MSLGLVLALLTTAACGSGAGAGATCSSHGDCASGYQCQRSVCVPRCSENSDCGDGYQCSAKGICNAVLSSIGDACQSEWECGLGQSCVLDESDPDNDQVLAASCQKQGVGATVGAPCELDGDCRSGLCTLGHCSLLCTTKGDCPRGPGHDFGCELIPRIIESDSALFYGCLQSTGVLTNQIVMEESAERLRIPVPSSAQSFAVVATVNDDAHRVGATRVVSPSGDLLFNGSSSLEQFVANKIRYLPQRRVSTLLVPNSDSLELETGIYQIDMEASLPPFGPGTTIPEVTVFYKLDESRILDLHFYFLDLDEHPCRDSFDAETLDATTAQVSTATGFQEIYLGELRNILASANIQPGEVSYTDVDRADLDGIVGGDANDLFALATNETGIAIFFVRSLSPDGVQVAIGGTPGPPRSPGTSASGIAISADTLCYRPWDALARVTAHSIATQMGLWNNRDPEGTLDPISDSDSSSENLMFFGEFGGTELSPGQKRVLGGYPGLR